MKRGVNLVKRVVGNQKILTFHERQLSTSIMKTHQKPLQMPPTEAQSLLMNSVAQTLTDLNIKRFHEQSKYESFSQQHSTQPQRFKDLLFVTISGIPAREDQFGLFNLPGEVLSFYPVGFNPTLKTEQEREQDFKFVLLSKQAQRIFKSITEADKAYKKLIFLYHSDGTFIFNALLQNHPQIRERLIGLIDLGALPIRKFPYLANKYKTYDYITAQNPVQYMLDNMEEVHQIQVQTITTHNSAQLDIKEKAKRMPLFPVPKDQYETMCSLAIYFCREGLNVFQSIRNLPDVLKLIIYGRNDMFFQAQLSNEKAIYFSYVKSIPSEAAKFYEKQLQKNYEDMFKKRSIAGNIQSRFIYSIPGGGHSVHYQTKHKQQLKEIVHEYIQFVVNYEFSKNQPNL